MARPARPLLGGLVLALLALGLTAAGCALLFDVRPFFTTPPLELSPWASATERDVRIAAWKAAAAWTPAKTLHVAVLYSAAAACLTAAALVLRNAVRKLMSA
jgi:hypothetical protein